ncbi:HpsJ-like protein, cyanoexosortase A-associated [Leptolyngbya sp. AN02str]|uniref:HpsJ-like protein, cyanoexosortase A-associated n=1 Tax=Leptolyngbya sp. AN02str TaxID=3423363 RepID=UPI003D312C44
MQMKSDGQGQPSQHKSASLALLRLAGYGLLILTALDLGAILLPPQLMNPVWEFQTLGQIVERVPLPLLALVLIFFGESQLRGKWEKPLLKALSWLSLAFAIFLVIITPLWGVMNTVRINAQNSTELNTQLSAQREQIAAVEAQLSQASVEDIASFLESQGLDAEVSAEASKEQLLAELETAEQRMENEFNAQSTSRRNTLLESSLKWNLSALISSFIFAYMWHLTRWSRGSSKRVSQTGDLAKQS